MNLFATLLTYTAPSANYRGESEESRTVIQKITKGRYEYAIISPEAIRNALREQLRRYGLECNRARLGNEEQLAVRFEDYPHPAKYVDDFYFGYLVAQRKDIPAKIVKERDFQFKRDSVLRMNLAVAVEPYRSDTVFTQSPLTVKNEETPWQNSSKSALLHREVVTTPFQYPIAFNLEDCELNHANGETQVKRKLWFRTMLRALSELNDVSGNHARSYFEFAPASIVLRYTKSLVAGYDTYGFKPDGSLPEIIEGILAGDYPGSEFHLGGRLVREVIKPEQAEALKAKGAHLYRMAAQALDAIATITTGEAFSDSPAKG
jgi:CRISPR-associated protein Cst2